MPTTGRCSPGRDDGDAIDLNCAAASAPPGLAAAYVDAVAELPAYLGGHGYFPAGLPRLQEAIAATYDARGLPTDPEQIMVTPGALSAAAIVARALTGPGERVLVETPVYPNATQAIRQGGARITGSPVDPEGWDLQAVAAALRQTSPRLAYLIPDFQNPTGHVMTDEQRAEYATHLRRTRTVAVVDEAHQALALEGQEMPRPFAAYAPDTITIGSASKSFWGGLRLGWLRAPHARMDALTQARLGLDLGAPVLEQLVLTRLLAAPDAILARAPGPAPRAARRAGRGGRAGAARVAVHPAPRRARAVVPAAGAGRDRGGRRRRGPRRDRRARPGVRRRGRARPLRPDPLDPPGRRARARRLPPRRRLGHRLAGRPPPPQHPAHPPPHRRLTCRRTTRDSPQRF